MVENSENCLISPSASSVRSTRRHFMQLNVVGEPVVLITMPSGSVISLIFEYILSICKPVNLGISAH